MRRDADMGAQSAKLVHLGLLAYPRDSGRGKWLLPVCGAALRDRLSRLSPSNPGNWEEVDLDGCPTICYRMRTRQIRHMNRSGFQPAYKELETYLGPAVAKEFFPDIWLRYNNDRARARNRWEQEHGGLRPDRFNRGPSVRAAARMSIV